MELVIILCSLLILGALYFYVSIKEGNYINVFTPAYIAFVPAYCLLEALHVALLGPSASIYAYLFSYASYLCFFIAYVFSYVKLSTPALRLPYANTDTGSGPASYILLAIAFLIYLPVLIEFREYLLSPRQIYEQTRTGYGLNYFLSITFCDLALITHLFKKRTSIVDLIIFLVPCFGLLWLHGAKGPLLVAVLILMMYWTFVSGKSASLMNLMVVGIGMVVVAAAAFYVTTPQLLAEEGILGVAGYSEYNRNGMLILDSGVGPFYGRLTLESQIYPRIPRLLFPEKPNDYGEFYLDKYFFPDAFERDEGAPSFGYGIVFADFGVATIPIMAFAGFMSGLMLRFFVTGFHKYRRPGDFVMVLFGSGISLISLSNIYLLPESLLLASLCNMAVGVRFRSRPA